jgi:gas vesicle structural protein
VARAQNLREYSAIDVIDRVLDKGIVIDAMACVSVLGLDHIVDIDARVVVASIETYVQYAEPISQTGSVARPRRRTRRAKKRPSATSASTAPQAQNRLIAELSEQDRIRAHGLSIQLDRR